MKILTFKYLVIYTVLIKRHKDKTFIVVQFITVQIESTIHKGSKVIGKLSSLWHSSILWHSLERVWIIVRHVSAYVFLYPPLHYTITLLWFWMAKWLTKSWLFHVRLFGLGHNIDSRFCNKQTKCNLLPSTL